MKRLISPILFFLMMGVIFIGCATMTSEQGSGTYDHLRNSVGNSPFVGATSTGARDLAWFQMYGP